MRSIREMMTRDLITVKPTTTVSQVAQLLSKHLISSTPVLDEAGEVVGVISASDLAAYLAGNGSARPKVPDEPAQAKDLMTTLVCSVDIDADLKLALDTMLNFRIHRVLVTEEGRLVGQLSALDLVREVRQSLD